MPYYVLVTGPKNHLLGAIAAEGRRRLWQVGRIIQSAEGSTVVYPEGVDDGHSWDAVIDLDGRGHAFEARKHLTVSDDVSDVRAAAVDICNRASSRTSSILRHLGASRLLP
ncbi:hypothetical protein F7Q99_28020 [Streptomyces kaniharaensis]|uniref:Uncharacterized protein n=1 Tax=Streptomyces kaniharaensis TaxID=212423 RepID=A0A6N7L2J0_9ACTN|nr:hypothetical protein [Streptomyces kaniharaensis]MQS15993.1 hypothetical protein [Streptomyces kaniharaensis]